MSAMFVCTYILGNAARTTQTLFSALTAVQFAVKKDSIHVLQGQQGASNVCYRTYKQLCLQCNYLVPFGLLFANCFKQKQLALQQP